jgi:hypothetical protein
MLNVAKEAPSAFLPHLEALVGRIQQLWDAGQLREGEKVSSILCSMFRVHLVSDSHCETHPAVGALFVAQDSENG